jgi:hypothetical protein
VLISCLATATVLAQEPRSPDELNRLSDEALALAGKGEMDKAVAIWEDILGEVSEVAAQDIRINLAVAYKRTERLPEAWYFLSAYLARDPSGDPKVTAEMKSIESRLEKTHIKVTFACDPDGVLLELPSAGGEAALRPTPGSAAGSEDIAGPGSPAGSRAEGGNDQGPGRRRRIPCPAAWWLPPGLHSVVAQKAGFETGTVDVEVKAGAAQQSVEVRLEQARPPEVVPRFEGTAKAVRPAKNKGKTKALAWAIFGGGLALAATGGILQGVAYGADQRLKEDYPADASLSKEEFDNNEKKYDEGFASDVQPKLVAAYVLYGVGGAATLAGLVGAIIQARKAPGPRDKTSVRLVPMLAPGTIGAALAF